jgi:hypothetical protein
MGLFFFLVVLNSRPHACRQVLYHLSHSTSPSSHSVHLHTLHYL